MRARLQRFRHDVSVAEAFRKSIATAATLIVHRVKPEMRPCSPARQAERCQVRTNEHEPSRPAQRIPRLLTEFHLRAPAMSFKKDEENGGMCASYPCCRVCSAKQTWS